MNLKFVFIVNMKRLWLIAIAGCTTDPTGYAIVAQSKAPLVAVAGDALALEVVQTFSDGSTKPLPATATVAWTVPKTVIALSPDATDPIDPLPPAGAAPTGAFLINVTRSDITDTIHDVLFVLDAGAGGSLDVAANIVGQDGTITAAIAVTAMPDGDATAGAATYATNCASCHGATGDGTPVNADGLTYTIEEESYMYPAPGLNNAADSGNLGSDPAWNAALLAFAARSDADNGAIALRLPMPNWLGTSLTTQDFADIYAFLVATTD